VDYLFYSIQRFLYFSIPLGTQSVTVGSIILYSFVFFGFTLVSKFVRKLIQQRLFPRLDLAPSTQYVVLKTTHYLILIVALLTIVGSLGVNLSSLTFVAGLLSVGIGFGLQNIAANFVSGLILLFEQPVKVGDWVELGDLAGEVKEINLRTTGLETNDGVYIIVPNQDLLNGRVINGSLGSPYVCVHTVVGVDYGTDMNLVMRLLEEAARGTKGVLADPKPEVWLVKFGESSVDFEILTYIREAKLTMRMKAAVLYACWWKLKENNIEIPYPQRDMNIRCAEPIPVKMIAEKP
jgi:small-conductance mechanosensitive channel